MRRMRPMLLGVALAMTGASLTLAMPGCSVRFELEIEGTIRDSADGKPLAGVRVVLDARGALGWPESLTTNKDGEFTAAFQVPADKFSQVHDGLPKWQLLLSKKGFHDDAINVSLRRAPDFRKEHPSMIVIAYMRTRK